MSEHFHKATNPVSGFPEPVHIREAVRVGRHQAIDALADPLASVTVVAAYFHLVALQAAKSADPRKSLELWLETHANTAKTELARLREAGL